MTHDEEIRSHLTKRADELDSEANEIEDEAWECGDLEERLAMGFEIADLRARAHKLRVQADIRQAVTG